MRKLTLIWLGIAVIAAGLIVFAPLVPQWGELHPAHEKARFQELKSGQTLTQTFLLEYPAVDTVAVWLDRTRPLSREGGIELELVVGKQQQKSTVAYTDIKDDGLVLFHLQPIVKGKTGEPAKFILLLPAAGQVVNVKFQIDASKYPTGEFIHSHRSIKGDAAFQVHYLRYSLGAYRTHVLYAFFILVSAGLIAFGFERYAGSFGISKQDWWWALGVGVVAALVYGIFFMWWPGIWLGPGDFTKDVSYLMAGQQALSVGDWPVWSHAICGGMPLLGNPESNVLSIGTLLSFVMRPEIAMWALLAFEAGIGAAGVFLLARAFKVSVLGSILAAGVAVLSGAYPYRIVEGFTMIGGATAAVPWVLLGWYQVFKKPTITWVLVGGLGLTYMFWRGEVHILTGLLLVLGCLVVAQALVNRSWRPFLLAAIIFSVFFMSASAKLLAYGELPTFFSSHYRPYVTPLIHDKLLDDVFLRVHSRFFPVDVKYGKRAEEWANFGAYVGLAPLLLAALALTRRQKQWWFIWVGLGVSFVLMEGTLFDVVLQHVGPLAGLLRIPTRIVGITLVCLGVAAGGGLDRLRSFLLKKFSMYLVGLMVVLVLGDLLVADSTIFSETLGKRASVPAQHVSVPTLAFHVNDSVGGEAHASTLLAEGYYLPKLCADVVAEPDFVADLKDRSPLTLSSADLTPNEISVAVDSNRPVIVYSRFVSAWTSREADVMPRSDEAWQVLPHSKEGGEIHVRYVHGLTWVEMWLFITTLYLIGSAVFSGWSKRERV